MRRLLDTLTSWFAQWLVVIGRRDPRTGAWIEDRSIRFVPVRARATNSAPDAADDDPVDYPIPDGNGQADRRRAA